MSQGPHASDFPDFSWTIHASEPGFDEPAEPRHTPEWNAWHRADRFERRRLRVYVAGPMSLGDPYENVHAGLKAGRALFDAGLAPYVPHLDAFMFMGVGADRWPDLLEWDLEWVSVSEAVYRLPGGSKGADKECAVARELGIPVFTDINALFRWANDNRKAVV